MSIKLMSQVWDLQLPLDQQATLKTEVLPANAVESCLNLADWETPATLYPEGAVGKAKIVRKAYPRGYYRAEHQGPLDGHRYELFRATRSLPITSLQIRNRIWMVDDPPHWWAMQDHARYFHGHVVCAGLGLGLIVHALAGREGVEQITVIEREGDVIELVGPLLPELPSLTIVRSDWSSALPRLQLAHPDGVLFDLFVGRGEALWRRMIQTGSGLRKIFPEATIRVHGVIGEQPW